MPCALTCYASYARETGSLRIRLTKSHDFDLTDPIYKKSHHIRQIVLIRDPLYILTSWYALDQIETYRDFLLNEGINPTKIFLSHEKELLKRAYQIIEKNFSPKPIDDLIRWLTPKSEYISSFLKKWVQHGKKENIDETTIIKYEDIDKYIEHLTQKVSIFSERNLTINGSTNGKFTSRENPFETPAPSISGYLKENAHLFHEICEKLK